MTGSSGCCSPPYVDFDSQEAKDGRRCVAKRYNCFALVQFPLAVLTVISGGISFGLACANAKWPFMNVFPLILGAEMLVAAFCGRRITDTEVDRDISCTTKKSVGLNYVMCICCCTFVTLSITFSGQALGKCFSSDLDTYEDCTPNMDLHKAFIICNIVLAVLLMPTIYGTFSLYYRARMFGLTGRRTSC